MLFDAAGTLIELDRPLGETYAAVARRFGVELPAWRLQDAFARVFRAAPPMLFPDAEPAEVAGLERRWWRDVVRQTFLATDSTVRFADFDAFYTALYDHYAAASTWRAREGAADTLSTLHGRGTALAVVSNFDGRLPAILDGLGLSQWLRGVVLPAEAGALKPDRRIFALGLARVGAEAAHTVFVGDDAQVDLAGARAAGLRAIDVGDLATLRDLPERIRDLEDSRA